MSCKDHCIDHLRQAITCQGNTDIITFHTNKKGINVPNFDSPHVCRQYEPLKRWAEEHKAGDNAPDGREHYGLSHIISPTGH
jgi:hypothetical protein